MPFGPEPSSTKIFKSLLSVANILANWQNNEGSEYENLHANREKCGFKGSKVKMSPLPLSSSAATTSPCPLFQCRVCRQPGCLHENVVMTMEMQVLRSQRATAVGIQQHLVSLKHISLVNIIKLNSQVSQTSQ